MLDLRKPSFCLQTNASAQIRSNLSIEILFFFFFILLLLFYLNRLCTTQGYLPTCKTGPINNNNNDNNLVKLIWGKNGVKSHNQTVLPNSPPSLLSFLSLLIHFILFSFLYTHQWASECRRPRSHPTVHHRQLCIHWTIVYSLNNVHTMLLRTIHHQKE